MLPKKSIRDFFKLRPSQPDMKVASPVRAPTAHPSAVSLRAPSIPLVESSHDPSVVASHTMQLASLTKGTEPPGYTSSLSPQPSTDPSTPQQSEEATLEPLVSSNCAPDRVVKSSDDEDEDSDSSLEDLMTIFATKSSTSRNRAIPNEATTSTPSTSRNETYYTFQGSPLAIQPKFNFNLKSLIQHVEQDSAVEASFKRIKTMLAPKKDEEATCLGLERDANQAKSDHGALLESVVAGKEDGEMKNVLRAIMRTEATATEYRWYFFDTQSQPPTPRRVPFPEAAIPEEWNKELLDPKLRHNSFVSGFVENMVYFGKTLPDELYLWILNETSVEPMDVLRESYVNILTSSPDQTRRLVLPDVIQQMFQRLGATPNAVVVTEKMRPTQKLSNSYTNRDWDRLRSIVRLLGKTSYSLEQQSRTHIICMLLRMSVDQVVLENVDLLDAVQSTINGLCQYTVDGDWEACCQEICISLFHCVEQPIFRLQIVKSISSTSPRLHDLRRRIAMCFCFNDLSYSLDHPDNTLDLSQFIERLDSTDFDVNSKMDFRELTALILLLDIAVDDGRSSGVDLDDKKSEQDYNQNVDRLVVSIKNIMTSMGNPGASHISKLDAKEALELVSQRIADTVRTKKKPREEWFNPNRGRDEDALEAERKGMKSFVSTMKKIGEN